MSTDEETARKFAQDLAHSEAPTRIKAVKTLASYIATKKNFTDLDLQTLWKGLFFAMWHSDKPLIQLELAETLGAFTHKFSDFDTKLRYFKFGFLSVSTQWHSVDRFRVDKYYSLLRQLVHHVLKLLYNSKFEASQVAQVSAVLAEIIVGTPHQEQPSKKQRRRQKEALSAAGGGAAKPIYPTYYTDGAPVGVQLHFIDLFPTELSKQFTGIPTSQVPSVLDQSILKELLRPIFLLFCFAEKLVKNRTKEGVFDKTLDQYEEKLSGTPVGASIFGYPLSKEFAEFMSNCFFDFAKLTSTPPLVRNELYKYKEQFAQLLKSWDEAQITEEDENQMDEDAEGEEDEEEEEGNPKKKRKTGTEQKVKINMRGGAAAEEEGEEEDLRRGVKKLIKQQQRTIDTDVQAEDDDDDAEDGEEGEDGLPSAAGQGEEDFEAQESFAEFVITNLQMLAKKGSKQFGVPVKEILDIIFIKGVTMQVFDLEVLQMFVDELGNIGAEQDDEDEEEAEAMEIFEGAGGAGAQLISDIINNQGVEEEDDDDDDDDDEDDEVDIDELRAAALMGGGVGATVVGRMVDDGEDDDDSDEEAIELDLAENKNKNKKSKKNKNEVDMDESYNSPEEEADRQLVSPSLGTNKKKKKLSGGGANTSLNNDDENSSPYKEPHPSMSSAPLSIQEIMTLASNDDEEDDEEEEEKQSQVKKSVEKEIVVSEPVVVTGAKKRIRGTRVRKVKIVEGVNKKTGAATVTQTVTDTVVLPQAGIDASGSNSNNNLVKGSPERGNGNSGSGVVQRQATPYPGAKKGGVRWAEKNRVKEFQNKSGQYKG
eukprot:TRINITY_DN102_c1_g1_i2.p1 TRINITY_DN102_c1_g1~~TRINITY_DN102_c1_g1_i2.p1  ORF type:complete len:819 (-),score=324.94 TRINITY_DN102_c1_g1_i2:93-2549(-)